MAVDLPAFRYHPDPLATGSVERSDAACRRCGVARGAIYVGPVYAERDGLDGAVCPWCIADRSAAAAFDATFVDEAALDDAWPDGVADTIARRTPGPIVWQVDAWPGCCGDATAYLGPTGIAELRRDRPEWEGFVLDHIVHGMRVSGGAALRLLEALRRDGAGGPTAYAFRCLRCRAPKFHIDRA